MRLILFLSKWSFAGDIYYAVHFERHCIDEEVNYATFFERATINPNTHLITGVICGYRIEEIENPVTRKARYLDKLIDELAKGRKMEKILRR